MQQIFQWSFWNLEVFGGFCMPIKTYTPFCLLVWKPLHLSELFNFFWQNNKFITCDWKMILLILSALHNWIPLRTGSSLVQLLGTQNNDPSCVSYCPWSHPQYLLVPTIATKSIEKKTQLNKLKDLIDFFFLIIYESSSIPSSK